MKRVKFCLTNVFLLLFVIPLQSVFAQMPDKGYNLPPPELKAQKFNPVEGKVQNEQLEKKYPLLAKLKKRNVGTSMFKNSKRGAALQRDKSALTKSPMMKIGDGRELWGNVILQNTWTSSNEYYGMYSFKASSPINVEALCLKDEIDANGGGAVVDGKLHFINYQIFFNMIFANYYVYDAETWEKLQPSVEIKDFSLLAAETAVHHESGTVYGVFYTADLNDYEFGVIDYNSMTRTTISQAQHSYVALGVTSDKTLYGVASDGNLYKIDSNTGSETLVGNTGVTVSTPEGQFYVQSGEIDQKTNTFYWATIDANDVASLYVVDLETGQASKVSDFPNEEQILMLTVPKPEADNDAPAAPTNLTIVTNGGDLECRVTAKAPTTTYGGEPLVGNIQWEVIVDGESNGTGTVSPGNPINRMLTTLSEGLHTFEVRCSNNAGNGAIAKTKKYLGYDIPKPVTDVELNIDNESGLASLSWAAPDSGVNNGYIGPLKYEVTRYPDGVVTKDISGTSFSETIPLNEMKAYSYGVKAVNNGNASQEVMTNQIIAGKALTPPYAESFDTKDAMALYTVVDANGDKRTWAYDSEKSCVKYTYNMSIPADDWLFTPPLKLQPGRIYTLSFKASCYRNTYPERIEVKYGTDKTPEAMVNVALTSTDITSAEQVTYTGEIIVDAEQDIYVGFHSISDANMYYMYLDDIAVDNGVPMTVPDAVTEFTVTPGAGGTLNATVKFNAPDKDINGDGVSTLTKVVITRSDSEVKTYDNPAPGETLTFIDENPVNGFNTYTVTAYNEDGKGRSVSVTAFIGVDVPLAPQESRLTDQTTSVRIEWESVGEVGANGQYVNPAGVTYNVYTIDGYYADFLDETNENSYTVNMNTAVGSQDMVKFGLSAKNAVGQSEIYTTPAIIVGKPYDIPFRESFSGGEPTYPLWWMANYGGATFSMSEIMSSDGDNGSIVFTSKYSGNISYINTGKIGTDKALNPAVSFMALTENAGGLNLTVEMHKPDGTYDEAYTITYDDENQTAGWTKHSFAIDSKFLSEPYFIIKFRATASGSDQTIYLDDIMVMNMITDDLGISMETPKNLTKGRKGTFKVAVENLGENSASDFSVRLIKGDNIVAETTESGTVEPLERSVYELSYAPSLFSDETSVTLKAEISYAADKNADNNAVSAELSVIVPEDPTPENVKVEETEAGKVEVTWNAPTPRKEVVMEDFESYDPWSTDDIGGWKMIDADFGRCGQIYSDYPYPNQYERFAYMVFNPEDMAPTILYNNPKLAPHSGNQYLAGIYSLGEDGKYIDADNWLISPILTGEEQTVSFYISSLNAKYQETFEVLYSTTGNDISDFTVLGEPYTVLTSDWTEYEVVLPAGTKYFAIHHTSDKDNAFFFKIDDITYTAGSGDVTGYNVYRNEELIGSVGSASTSFTDAGVAEGTYTYAVSALYSGLESMPAKADPKVVTGIETIEEQPGTTYNVFTVDGKCIGLNMKTLKGLKQGAYVINGKTVMVK